ncbi:MAG: hypothetical protein ACI9RO_000010 [Alteromonas macleodii]|jgi:hypothetical protein
MSSLIQMGTFLGYQFVRKERQSFAQQSHRTFAPTKQFFRERRSSFGIDPRIG